MSQNLQPFKCGECENGMVKLQSPKDDFLSIMLRGHIYQVPIPIHLMIPKCDHCGEVFLGYSNAALLAKQMGGSLP